MDLLLCFTLLDLACYLLCLLFGLFVGDCLFDSLRDESFICVLFYCACVYTV